MGCAVRGPPAGNTEIWSARSGNDSKSKLHITGGYNYGSLFGGYGGFRLDMAYPLEIIAMFFFSMLALLLTIYKRLQARPSLKYLPLVNFVACTQNGLSVSTHAAWSGVR